MYNGKSDNNNLFYLVSNLTTGLKYTLRAYALNFDGVSLQASTPASYYVCTEAEHFAGPVIVDQTSTAINIAWAAPEDDGGCRILSYVVYRDDGNGANIDVEVNTDNDPAVRDLPSLNSLRVTDFPANSEGKTFRFQVKVITT